MTTEGAGKHISYNERIRQKTEDAAIKEYIALEKKLMIEAINARKSAKKKKGFFSRLFK